MAEEKIQVGDENPQVSDEPSEEQPIDAKAEAEALLAELKTLGVENKDALHNMAHASSQTGHMARQLGEERQRAERIERELQEIKAKVGSNQNYSEPSYGEPVDLGNVIEDKLEKFWSKQQAQQAKAQQAMMEQYNIIRSDSMYGTLKDTFEKHVQNPDVSYAIQQGWKTPEQAYNDVKVGYLTELNKRSAEKLETLLNMGAKPVGKKVPHVESGQTETVPMPTEELERTERMTKLKQAESTDDNLEAMIKELIPDADPIVRA